MKNKKGYSLIELLIVISILALILAISVPKVLGVLEKIDKTIYQKNVEEMVQIAKLQYETSEEDGVMESIPDSGLSYTFSNGNFANDNKLNFKGDKPYSGTITLTNDKKVIVDNLVSNNKKWCAIKEYDEEEIKVVKANDPEYECIPEDIPIPDKSICELEHKTKWEFKDGVRVKNEYYYIDSPCDLYELSYRVNNGESFSGKIVKLRNNLDMSNIKDITEKLIEKYSTTEFSPIGNNNNRFSGTFDGGAKTIGNLTINKSAEDYIGLFGYIENATIYGLKIKNATIKGKDYVGTVAGKIYRGSAKEIEIESTNVTGH